LLTEQSNSVSKTEQNRATLFQLFYEIFHQQVEVNTLLLKLVERERERSMWVGR